MLLFLLLPLLSLKQAMHSESGQNPTNEIHGLIEELGPQICSSCNVDQLAFLAELQAKMLTLC